MNIRRAPFKENIEKFLEAEAQCKIKHENELKNM